MQNIIRQIEAKLTENAGRLGLVIVKSDSSEMEIQASFGNKKRTTNKNLDNLTGLISDALVASGIDAAGIYEMELKIGFIVDNDEKYQVTLNLEGKKLTIRLEKK